MTYTPVPDHLQYRLQPESIPVSIDNIKIDTSQEPSVIRDA